MSEINGKITYAENQYIESTLHGYTDAFFRLAGLHLGHSLPRSDFDIGITMLKQAAKMRHEDAISALSHGQASIEDLKLQFENKKLQTPVNKKPIAVINNIYR